MGAETNYRGPERKKREGGVCFKSDAEKRGGGMTLRKPDEQRPSNHREKGGERKRSTTVRVAAEQLRKKNESNKPLEEGDMQCTRKKKPRKERTNLDRERAGENTQNSGQEETGGGPHYKARIPKKKKKKSEDLSNPSVILKCREVEKAQMPAKKASRARKRFTR